MLTWDGWQRARETGRVLEDVLDRGIPGAIVEVGVFKGGLSAYLQGVLLARSLSGSEPLRKIWLVDSFQGMSPPNRMHSVNAGDDVQNGATRQQRGWAGKFAVGEHVVRRNLERYGLLEAGNVRFLRGFVNDTLPYWPEERGLALLRVDVDLYAPTYDALHYLYPLLHRGGAVLFDDFKLSYSKSAIDDFRLKNSITTKILFLPDCADAMAYWIKE